MGKLNKGNIISCLVGIVLGTAGTFGGQALFYIILRNKVLIQVNKKLRILI